MRVSRWIYVPLICGISLAFIYTLLGLTDTFLDFIGWFVTGAIFGFVMEIWSRCSAKIKTGRNDEEVQKVRQHRNITLLLSYEKAFELCRDAVNSINPAKIKTEDIENGIIEARTRVSWEVFGVILKLDLKKIGENLTEVEISTRPIPRTVLFDYGEGWKYTEKISKYLKEKDADLNKKALVASVEMFENIYVKQFQKEQINLEVRR